jgi:hypothetical protein
MSDHYPPAFDYMVPMAHPYIMGDSFDPRAPKPIWRFNRPHFSYGAEESVYVATGFERIDAVCKTVSPSALGVASFEGPQQLVDATRLLMCKLIAKTHGETEGVSYNELINVRLVKLDSLISLVQGQYTLDDEISFVNEVVGLVDKEKKAYRSNVKSTWYPWKRRVENYLTRLVKEGTASGEVSKEELEKAKENKKDLKEWYEDWRYFVPLSLGVIIVGLQVKKRYF